MSDKYYTSFTDYFNDNNPRHHILRNYLARRERGIKLISESKEYNKQIESQKTELETLRSGQPKTVNYGTAISVDDITKSGIEADDERARAAALEQLEKERLGANIVSMGQTSLLRGLK